MLWFASGRVSYENPRRLILRSLQPARTDEISSVPIRPEWSRYTTSGVALPRAFNGVYGVHADVCLFVTR
jgi:hypothetical protein